MNPVNLDLVQEYANKGIINFHQQRMKLLQEITLSRLLGFCLFRPAHTISLAGDVVEGSLDALLCSSEEKLFEAFLKDLAVFVAARSFNGCRSTIPGFDLEFQGKDAYIVSVISGLACSSQHKKLAQDLGDAVIRVKQARTGLNVQPVLGICYGKTRTNYIKAGYLKVVGQNFWYLISGNEELYTDIIEPIGYRAKEHNEAFDDERGKVINRFTRQFIEEFCDPSGAINWARLVEFNSGNYDLDKFLS